MINYKEIPLSTIIKLLMQCGVNDENIVVEEYARGGNNKIYRISVDGRTFALKKYLKDESDKRDRLGTEWRFITNIVHAGVSDVVPYPYAVDKNEGVALYQFIDGKKLLKEDVSDIHIQSAMNFIKKINSTKIRNISRNLNDASETGFSINTHIQILENRLSQLSNVLVKNDEFSSLLGNMMLSFERLKKIILTKGPNPFNNLKSNERCISPSDFGFHNILVNSNQEMFFIDFEYAGWDDPAKLAADFFFQPETPVDDSFYEVFLDACINHIRENNIQYHKERARLLRPLFGLRWCCIILNPFEDRWAARQIPILTSKELTEIQEKRLTMAKELLTKTDRLVAFSD